MFQPNHNAFITALNSNCNRYLPADLSDPAVSTGSMQPLTLLQDFGEIASWTEAG